MYKDLRSCVFSVCFSFPVIRNEQPKKPVETFSAKSQSKRSAPKASRNDQPQKPGDTISPKSQSTRSAPKARQHDQPQKPGFGCPRPNFRRKKTKDLCATAESIWASDLQHSKLLPRASGHQSSQIPPYSRGIYGSNPPYRSANFGGSPRKN